jgi:hypothetical protein
VKWLLGFLVLCVALAVLKSVLIALMVALLLVLAYAFVMRPGETLGFLVALTALNVASARPLAFILTVGAVALVVVLAGTWRKARTSLLLADARSKPRGRLAITARRDER